MSELLNDSNNCLRCLKEIAKNRKYCGGNNFSKICPTCNTKFLQRCQGKERIFCCLNCQNSNPEVIEKANVSRKKLDYQAFANDQHRKAIQEKYGVENVSQIPFVKAKKAAGGPTGFARPEFGEIIQGKFGVANVSQLSEVKEKKRQTTLRNYGVDNPSKDPATMEKIRETTFANFGVRSVLSLLENQQKAAALNKFRISKVNKAWQIFLKDRLGIDFEFEQAVGNSFAADLGFENLRIDINPSVSHSFTRSFPQLTGKCDDLDCKRHAPRERLYHQKRALEAEKNGLVLLQYFDWFDQEIFLDVVRSKLRMGENNVFARKCELREISQREANKFFLQNHLIGRSNGQTLCVGLFYEGSMVHCQSYGKSRLNKSFDWEAIRSCSKLNFHVPGAFSKCDKYFFNKIDPDSVVSYVDLSISQGGTDSKFDGWELHKTNQPSSTWVNYNSKNGPKFIKDNTARRISADRLLGFEVGVKYPLEIDGKKISNAMVLEAEGYLQVFDCGTKVFVKRKIPDQS